MPKNRVIYLWSGRSAPEKGKAQNMKKLFAILMAVLCTASASMSLKGNLMIFKMQ